MKNKILFLGIGNYLMGDEGVGVYIANKLAESDCPEGVGILDGGTSGLHMLGIMEQFPVVVMADATLDGRDAGTVRLLEPRFSADFPRAMSTHDLGLRDVIDGLTFTGRLPKIYLFVISVEQVQPMYVGLSPAVQQAADTVIRKVQHLLRNIPLNQEEVPTILSEI